MTSIEARPSRITTRRSFTLVELIVAGVITAFVLGTVSASLSNLARAKSSSRQRLEAYLRADSALERIRRDVVSIVRHDDLFFTRFVLLDQAYDTPAGRMDRDEMLLFSNRLRQLRSLNYNGEGTEYETQYRVMEDDYGNPTLWQRRDPFPDEYPRGGGLATPVTDSVVGLSIEAYDGFQWQSEWDSDFDGLPHAVRIIVTASGEDGDEDVYEAPFAILRTVVSVDRILLPRENLAALYALEHGEEESEDEAANTPTSLDDLGIPADALPDGVNIDIDSDLSEMGGEINIGRPGPNYGDPRWANRRDDQDFDVRRRPTTSPRATNSSTGGNRGGNGGGGGGE